MSPLDVHENKAASLHMGLADGLVALPILLLASLAAVKAFLVILRASQAGFELVGPISVLVLPQL